MIEILLITNKNKKYEDRISEMLEDLSSTYRLTYNLSIVEENNIENQNFDFAISLVKFVDLDGKKVFDGLPIVMDTCGEKIEKDILNAMLKLKVKETTSKR